MSSEDLTDQLLRQVADLQRRMEHLETLEYVAACSRADDADHADDSDHADDADHADDSDHADDADHADVADGVTAGGILCPAPAYPWGDFGVCNGHFDQGPDDDPDGWDVSRPNATSTGTRMAGAAYSGQYLFRGGNGLNGQNGCEIYTSKWFPVHESRDYYMAAAFRGNTAASRAFLTAACYSAAGAYIGAVTLWSGAPGVAWALKQRRVGPNGDVAFIANTRYARVDVLLAWPAQKDDDWVDVDYVQFQEMKAAYSAGIHLINTRVTDTAQRNFAGGAGYVLHAGSPMTLTLEEPGYIWFWYMFSEWVNNARIQSGYNKFFVDGGALNPGVEFGEAIANTRNKVSMMGRTDILAAGNHTVDLRVLVGNAADTASIQWLTGIAFYTRAY